MQNVDFRSKLSAEILAARKARKLSLTAVEAQSGVSKTTINHLERGERSVGFDAVAKVAWALGLELCLHERVEEKSDK